MKRRPKLRLTECDDGTWICRSKELPNSHTTGATPDEAIEKMRLGLDDYHAFVRHIEGTCGEGCQRCADGDAKTKGIWNRVDDE